MPQGIAINGENEVYIADTYNNRIQVFSSNGTYKRKIGSLTPGIGSYQFYHPRGLNFDQHSGALYVADTYNNRIMKFNNRDQFLYTTGVFPVLVYPNQILPDGEGKLFITDTGNNRLLIFKEIGPSVTHYKAVGDTRIGDKQYAGPYDVEVDSSGNIFVADSFNHRILKYNSSGTLVSKWGSMLGVGGPIGYGSYAGQFFVPRQIAIDRFNNVYVADSVNHRIQKFSNSGVFLWSYGSYGTLSGFFQFPSGVAVDSKGNIFVADSENNRIQKFNAFFVYQGGWGKKGTNNGEFSQPMQLAVDSQDHVYVVDRINNRIQKFTNNGKFITKWGTNNGNGNLDPLENWGKEEGDLFLPTGISIDQNDHVYVTDTSNNRMNVYDNNGNFIEQFGGFSGAAGQFFSPQGLDVNQHGEIIIADGLLQRISFFKKE